MNQLISIITPVYNAEKTVEKAISSILAQTYTCFELLIVDDYSSDNTLSIVESFRDERIRIFRNETNLGSLLSRNKLFSEAKGEVILFQDADDFSEPNRLYEIILLFDQNDKINFVGSNVNYFNEKNKFLSSSKLPLAHHEIASALGKTIPMVFASTAIRSSVFNSIGGFREYFCELGNYDYDWMFRIAEKHEVANIENPLYNVVIRHSSNSKIINNPKKLIGHEIVQFLGKQRVENDGKDSLYGLEFDHLQNFEKDALKKYKADPSLFLYKRVEAFMSYGDYPLALKTSIKAIWVNPKKMRNWRTILYVSRRYLLNKLR